METQAEKEKERREKKNARQREYHKNNKDKIHEKKNVKISCSCGMQISSCNIHKHLRNKWHTRNINERQNILEERVGKNLTQCILEFLPK